MFTNSGNNQGGFFQQDETTAGGGFGGNNFNSQQKSGGFSQWNSNQNQNASGQKKVYKPRIFVPCTLKMIIDAKVGADDALEISGEPVNDVLIVGTIVERIQENMRTIFVIDDGTDMFRCIFYQKGENELPYALKALDYKDNMCVRVYGSIRIFKDEKALVGSNIQEVSTRNDVTNHLLKVFTAHMVRKHGVLSRQEMQNASAAPANAAALGSDRRASGMQTNTQDYVLKVMQQLKSQHGSNFVSKNDVWSSCNGKMSNTDFNGLIAALEEDGTIYQAGNADTFCLTD